MKKTALFLFAIITIIACNSNTLDKNTFQLEATLNGIKDGSVVIIIEEGNNIVDSAKVINEKAVLSGKIIRPKNVKLFVQGTQNYKHLWLEASKMTIQAENGKFRDATITGSSMQTKNEEYQSLLKPYWKIQEKMESLDEDYVRSLKQNQIDSLQKIYNQSEIDEDNESMRFIRENPSHLLSAYLLDFYSKTFGRDSVKPLFLNLDKSLQETKYGKSIIDYLNVNIKVAIGDKFPHVSLKNVNDELKSSGEIQAKYLLIEFWASDCGPCRITNPKLVNIYKKYREKGFDIYGISFDTNKKAWKNAIEKDGLLWENVVDLGGRKGKTAFTFGIDVIPHNFLLDSEGKVIGIDLWSDELEKKLGVLLQ